MPHVAYQRVGRAKGFGFFEQGAKLVLLAVEVGVFAL